MGHPVCMYMKKVTVETVDNRDRYTFSDWRTSVYFVLLLLFHRHFLAEEPSYVLHVVCSHVCKKTEYWTDDEWGI